VRGGSLRSILAPSGIAGEGGLDGPQVDRVDEHEASVVETDGPASAGFGDASVEDSDSVTGRVAEIVDDDPGSLIAAARVDPDPMADGKV
jgi:hypothetical protein